jgi:hypothetical protein
MASNVPDADETLTVVGAINSYVSGNLTVVGRQYITGRLWNCDLNIRNNPGIIIMLVIIILDFHAVFNILLGRISAYMFKALSISSVITQS